MGDPADGLQNLKNAVGLKTLLLAWVLAHPTVLGNTWRPKHPWDEWYVINSTAHSMLHCCTELMHSLEPHQHRRVCAEIVLKMKFSLNSGVSPFVILLWVHSVCGCFVLLNLFVLMSASNSPCKGEITAMICLLPTVLSPINVFAYLSSHVSCCFKQLFSKPQKCQLSS